MEHAKIAILPWIGTEYERNHGTNKAVHDAGVMEYKVVLTWTDTTTPAYKCFSGGHF